MNSAPSSTGSGTPGSRTVQQRPPTRSRASSTSTERPARPSSAAAESPAAPAPMTNTSYVSVLFRLDAGVRGDLAPDADLFLDLRGELLRGAAGGRDAVVLQLLAGVLELERLGRLGADALDDRARQALRPDQAVPEDHVVAGHAGLGDGGHLRKRGNAPGSGDRDGAQLAGLDVRHRRRRAAEEDIGLAADRVGERRAGPLV